MESDRPVRTTRQRIVTVVRAILVVVGLVLALLAIAHYARGLSTQIHRLSIGWLVVSFLAVAVAAIAIMQCWRTLLRALGHDLGPGDASRIFFVSQIGKYLPGSVWPYLAQMDMAGRVGVPAVTMGAVGLVSIILGLVTAGLTAAVALPFVASGALGRYWPALLVLLPLASLLHPAVLRRAVQLLRRVARRPGPVPELSLAGIVPPILWLLVSWVLYGVQIWAITRSLGVHDGTALVLSIGGFALAWLVGFLVIVSPAGAGAREAVLVVVLTPVLKADGALLVALVSRLMTTAVDVLAAAAAAGTARWGRRRTTAPPPPSGPVEVATALSAVAAASAAGPQAPTPGTRRRA